MSLILYQLYGYLLLNHILPEHYNSGSLQHFQSELSRCKPFLTKIVPMQAMSQSTNNVYQSLLKSTEDKDAIDVSELTRRINFCNNKFATTLKGIKDFETRFDFGEMILEGYLFKLFRNGQPRPLFNLFSSFQTHIKIFRTNKSEKCPSSIWCRDSNSWSLERQSPPITTRPGLLSNILLYLPSPPLPF